MMKKLMLMILLVAASYTGWTQTQRPPLRAAFLDEPNIINDGITKNEIWIGIFNYNLPSTDNAVTNDYILKKDVPLMIGFVIDPNNATITRPWALTNESWYKMIKVDVFMKDDTNIDNRWTWGLDKYNSATYRYCIMTPRNDITLKPGEFFRIRVSNVITNYTDGPTDICMYYKDKDEIDAAINVNIGSLEKSPLVITEQKVGIGTNKPQAQLHVKGNSIFDGDALFNGNTLLNGNLRISGKLDFYDPADPSKTMAISYSGEVKDSAFISVPYGLPEDWNLILVPKSINASQEDGYWDDVLVGYTCFYNLTTANGKPAWLVRVRQQVNYEPSRSRYEWVSIYFYTEPFTKIPEKGKITRTKADITCMYLLVHK